MSMVSNYINILLIYNLNVITYPCPYLNFTHYFTLLFQYMSVLIPFAMISSIVVSPHILPFNFGEESVNSGDVASLQCTIYKGDLPINITWLHNDKPIRYNEGIVISYASKKVSTLTIDDVQDIHSGNFSCVAHNRAGLTSYSTELHVNGTIFIFYASKITSQTAFLWYFLSFHFLPLFFYYFHESLYPICIIRTVINNDNYRIVKTETGCGFRYLDLVSVYLHKCIQKLQFGVKFLYLSF